MTVELRGDLAAAPIATQARAPRRRRRLARQGRSRPRLRRRAPARPQPPPDHARLAGRPRGRRPLGPRHRRRVPPRLPRARPRGQAQRAHVPRDRRRRRAAHAAEQEKARTDGAAYEQDLRHHFAHAPVPKPPKPPEPPGDEALAAALRKAGARYEDAIVREAKRYGVPVSLICAVLEVETGFQNVFGHDNVRNPIKSPPRGLLAVTPDRYRQYLRFRRQGLGNQGVGPMQLTSPGLQDRADALGGCWKVDPNIRVGVEYLAGNIQRLGLYRGVAAYNGSTAYADKVLPLEKKWRAKLGGPARTHAGGSGPRTLKVDNPRMRGSDVDRAAEARQPALRGVEDRLPHRRGRRVRPRDAQGRAPRRVRARLRHRRLRARHHARAALEAAPPEPPHRRRARAREAAAARGCASCAPPPDARAAPTRSARTARSSARPTTARTRAGTGSPTTRSTSGSRTARP